MAIITSVLELEDRIKVSMHFSNGVPIPDVDETKEVLYKDIPNLPFEPKFNEKSSWREMFFIEKINKRICYYFEEWLETANSKMQGMVGGPYLVK
jgi:hypothetical protein